MISERGESKKKKTTYLNERGNLENPHPLKTFYGGNKKPMGRGSG